MLDEKELGERARDDCLAHAGEAVRGDLHVEIVDAEVEWDPILLRHVFDQTMSVWRRFNRFEVLLDDLDRPVGFVDPMAWDDCRWTTLSVEAALVLIRRTGWVSDLTEATGGIRRGENDCAELEIADPLRPEAHRRCVARINTATSRVISIQPVGVAHG